MLRLSAGDCCLSVPVAMPITVAVATITVAVAQFVTGTMPGAVAMMSSGLFELSSGGLAERVSEVEARRPPPKLFHPELSIRVFAFAVSSRRQQGVLLRMLRQRVLLPNGDRPVAFGVFTGRIAFDDASLCAVQQPVAVGALEADADSLGQKERQ